jgi:hypothetical protein
MALKGGERDVEERAPEMFSVSSAEIEDGGSYWKTQFLDFVCGL